jgi:hypothetical protein
MLKHLMNGGSLLSYALYEGENDNGKPEKTAVELAREAIAKNTTVTAKSDQEKDPPVEEADENNEEEEEETDEDETELDADGNPVVKDPPEETAEQKATRETVEKAQRKDARIQKRIDKAVAAQRTAEAETEKWKKLAEAKPADEKLTEAEVQARAEAIANEKVAAANVTRRQEEFNNACDKLQEAGTKIDKQFTPKAIAMAEELGAIPSRVIGILSDLDNGAEVLKFMVDDIDEAEKIYDLKDRPERLAIALVRISDKLIAAKKPSPKQISKVPDPDDKPVKGNRVNGSTIITEADTKNMDSYVKKRAAQREQQRKERGY